MTSGKIDCELTLLDTETLLTANRPTLLYLADQLTKLAQSGVNGSHFTIDKAGIAPETMTALTIALRDSD